MSYERAEVTDVSPYSYISLGLLSLFALLLGALPELIPRLAYLNGVPSAKQERRANRYDVIATLFS